LWHLEIKEVFSGHNWGWRLPCFNLNFSACGLQKGGIQSFGYSLRYPLGGAMACVASGRHYLLSLLTRTISLAVRVQLQQSFGGLLDCHCRYWWTAGVCLICCRSNMALTSANRTRGACRLTDVACNSRQSEECRPQPWPGNCAVTVYEWSMRHSPQFMKLVLLQCL
jgi:hypothetical protein